MKSAARIILLALAAMAVGLGIYRINAERVTGNVLPMPFGAGTAVVLSGSMEPELSVGDLLIVVPSGEYVVNDVVVFQDGRTPVVHRIVRYEDGKAVTKGDANNAEDEPIPREIIKGKVVFVIPFVGHIVNVLKTPFGVLAMLGAAVWMMESSFRKEKSEEQKQLRQLRAEIEKLKKEQK